MATSQLFILDNLTKGSKATLLSQDSQGNNTPFYTIEPSSSSKSNLSLTRATPEALFVGTIAYHTLSSKIELLLPTETISMRRKDLLSSGHTFGGFATASDTLTWNEESLFGHGFKLVNDDGKLFARYRRTDKKTGKGCFEVFIAADGELLDIILLSGIAAAEYRRRSNLDLESVGDVLGEFL